MNRLPSFAALRAFETASRRGSFREAAAELGVTPTAISHQIRRLEAEAGVKLFHRATRAVTLSEAGRAFAEEVSPALRRIEAAFASLEVRGDRPVVVIGAGPIFLSRWLAPRLTEFAAMQPDIDLRLHNSPSEIWRRAGEFDIAIAWGDGGWPGVEVKKLFTPSSVPLCAPSLLDGAARPKQAAELVNVPLLHHQSKQAWAHWFARHDLPAPESEGVVFEDANVMTYAAISGRGLMLGCPHLLSDDVAAGRLTPLFDEEAKGEGAYFILSPVTDQPSAVAVVRNWLIAQAERRAGAPAAQMATEVTATGSD